jgi:hypothetical protein
MISHLVYIHIGKNLPDCLYDSVYQTLLVSPDTKIYVILDDSLILPFRNKINKFNINLYLTNPIYPNMHIECIPLSILDNFGQKEAYLKFLDKLPESTKQFRDSFWISTTARFFYIESLIQLYQLTNVFHIENDIMIYENLNDIQVDKNKLHMVKDSPNRVIPSILFIPNLGHINKLNNYIINTLSNSTNLLNDMDLLGTYNSSDVVYFPSHFDDNSSYIMDGAALGQYLGGVDYRNIPNFQSKSLQEQQLLMFNNPTKGFINETCVFKPNTISIFRKDMHLNNTKFPIELIYATKENNNDINIKNITNLHIHSKQLYQFSSVNNLKYTDLISGDRIVSLCDFVITTKDILNYHKNLEHFVDVNNIILVQNFANVNMRALNKIFKESNKTTIKLFIYTHILEPFIQNILPLLDSSINYTLYLHNSDHGLNDKTHFDILNKTSYIKRVYSQNTTFYKPDKFKLLPIGIANSMFKHGDLLSLYDTMAKTYYIKKHKNLYININPNTYAYRHTVLQEIQQKGSEFNISSGKPYKEYLEELATHRFCLCVRGNGIACHREWECFYLGVIPVIINNQYTNTSAYVKYLQELNLPFYEIKEDTLERYSDDFFNEELYKKIMSKCNYSLYSLPSIKLDYYN